MKTFHLIIKGRVQGVWYRASARRQASVLGLKGYSKNLSNRDVEIIAQGNDADLSQFLDWCKKGPSGAKVDDIEINEIDPNENYETFEVRY